MKTYNKSRKLSTQTSFLITLTIALITSISAGLFLQKTYKELTLNFQTLMYQESNMTISSISDDISTIDSIYRLLVSNNTIYDSMESTSTEPSNYSLVEKQMSYVLMLNNVWEKITFVLSMYLQKPEKNFIYQKMNPILHRQKMWLSISKCYQTLPLLPFLLQRITITSILSVLFIIWQPEILWGL